MLQIRKPIIESQFEFAMKHGLARARHALMLEQFFDKYAGVKFAHVPELVYLALAQLLDHEDSKRIILYIPFEVLKDAPLWFREVYLDTWYSMLGTMDVRENFHEGDMMEPDARPNGELPRVVKCAHLTPWLFDFGYLTTSEVHDLISQNIHHEVLVRSFKETWGIISERNILKPEQLNELVDLTKDIPDFTRLEPLYISPNRAKWLEEKDKPLGDLVTPNACLTGPFYPNLDAIMDRLTAYQEEMDPFDIALVGGSFLRGYGTTDSDLDIVRYSDFKKDNKFYIGDPNQAHLFFNSAWLPGERVFNIEDYAISAAWRYRKNGKRRLTLERIESNLIQYRLLHKGYSRFTGKTSFNTSSHPEFDGDSPFYDDDFRKIATVLFYKYVWLPQA